MDKKTAEVLKKQLANNAEMEKKLAEQQRREAQAKAEADKKSADAAKKAEEAVKKAEATAKAEAEKKAKGSSLLGRLNPVSGYVIIRSDYVYIAPNWRSIVRKPAAAIPKGTAVPAPATTAAALAADPNNAAAPSASGMVVPPSASPRHAPVSGAALGTPPAVAPAGTCLLVPYVIFTESHVICSDSPRDGGSGDVDYDLTSVVFRRCSASAGLCHHFCDHGNLRDICHSRHHQSANSSCGASSYYRRECRNFSWRCFCTRCGNGRGQAG